MAIVPLCSVTILTRGEPPTPRRSACAECSCYPRLNNDTLTTHADGRFTHPSFHDTFLRAEIAAGDPRAAAATPCVEFFRGASTNLGTGESLVTSVPVPAATPVLQALLNAHVAGIRQRVKHALGLGGLGLTTAAFQQGITDLQTTANANADEARRVEQARQNKSFTDRHGPLMAQRMHRLCSAAAADHLPEVLRMLARSTSKNRDCGIVQRQ